MIQWHKHHIIPRHAGGTDDKSNLLKCNVAMHAFMHEQRYKETGDEYDRLAYLGLKGLISKSELIRKLNQEQASRTHKGKPKSKEHNEKVSKALTGLNKSQTHKNNVALSRSGGGYIITHPDSTQEFVPNLSSWCVNNNKSRQSFKQLLKMPERPKCGGRQSQLRKEGWKITKSQ